MHTVSLFTRMEGKLARWEGQTQDINACIQFVKENGPVQGGVLALIHKPEAQRV